MDWEKEKEYTGSLGQLFSLKEFKLTGGKADGVRAVEVKNSTGINMMVLPDRGMDIYEMAYKGVNLSYHTKSGIVAPQYYDGHKNGWLKSFSGGFLTTCGLQNTGYPFEEDGVEYGLHGKMSNTPADSVNIWIEEKSYPEVHIKGIMNDSQLFGANLRCEREFIIPYNENEILFKDRITNIGYRKEPVMILYHFNLGYPLLSEKSIIMIPTKRVMPRTAYDIGYMNEYEKVYSPQDNWQEVVFYHDMAQDEAGRTYAGIWNEELNMGVKISFSKKQLEYFVQWRMFGKGEYVIGLEPANGTIDGRLDAEKNKSLKHLESGQSLEYELCIKVVDKKEELEELL